MLRAQQSLNPNIKSFPRVQVTKFLQVLLQAKDRKRSFYTEARTRMALEEEIYERSQGPANLHRRRGLATVDGRNQAQGQCSHHFPQHVSLLAKKKRGAKTPRCDIENSGLLQRTLCQTLKFRQCTPVGLVPEDLLFEGVKASIREDPTFADRYSSIRESYNRRRYRLHCRGQKV